MTTINNLLELYSLKGNVISGKIILFQELDNKNLDYDEIKSKVVDEYEIMGKKHFVRSWKEYQKTKKWISFDE
tara:strand:- start:787 stop:1005 length:219 start_codon:yes stop_codon:yes gene_type:complete